jgi:hypothetical protein
MSRRFVEQRRVVEKYPLEIIGFAVFMVVFLFFKVSYDQFLGIAIGF